MIQPNKNVQYFVPSSVIHLTSATSTPQLITSNTNSLTTNSNSLVQQTNAQTYLHLLQNQQQGHLILTQPSPQIYLNPSSQKSSISHNTKEQHSGHSCQTIASSISSQPFLLNQLPVLANSPLILQNKIDSQNADKITFLQSDTANLVKSHQSNQKLDQSQFVNPLYSYALSPHLLSNRNLIINPNQLNSNLNTVQQNGQHIVLPSSSILSSSSNSAIQTTTTNTTSKQITKNVDKVVTKVVKVSLDAQDNESGLRRLLDKASKKSVNSKAAVEITPFVKPVSSRSSSPDLMIIESRSNIEKVRRGRKLKSMSEKMLKNQQIKKERKLNPRMIIPKTTRQMNNELLEADEVKSGNNQESCSSTDTANNDQIRLKNDFTKLTNESNGVDAADFKNDLPKKQQKKKAIVKPQVLMNHLVDGYLIQESKRKFSQNHRPNEKNSPISKVEPLSDAPKIDSQSADKTNEKVKKHKSNSSNNHSTSLKAKNHKLDQEEESLTDSKVTYLKRGIYKWSVDEAFELVKHSSGVETANQLKALKFDGYSLALFDIGNLRSLGFEFKLGPVLLLNEKVESYKKISKPTDEHDYLPKTGADIFKWSVEDVKEFVTKLCGDNVNADEFEEQQIDGQSLTLINFDQIKNDLNVPYGQALKIYHEIKRLKN